MDEQSDIFSPLFVRSLELTLVDDITAVERVIDELLMLNYGKRIFAITKQIAGEILCHYASNTRIIRSGDERILAKYFQLIVHLSSSQELTLESDAVNSLLEILQPVWPTCMQSSSLFQGLLDAIAAITYQNGPYISQDNLLFLFTSQDKKFTRIVLDSTSDISIRRTAVQCLSGFCVALDNGDQLSDEYMEQCLKIFISALHEQSTMTTPDVLKCRLIFSLTKGLHNILSSSSNVHINNLRSLLSVLKKYMVYGLPGLPSSTTEELQPVPVPDLYPSRRFEGGEAKKTTDSTPQKGKMQDKKKKRKSKPRTKFKNDRAATSNTDYVFGMEQLQLDQGQSSGFKGQQKVPQFRPAWSHVTSSESEYSDTEGAQRAKLRSFLSKIRQMSLGVLYFTMRRTDKHSLLGYWSSFLPDSPTLLTTSSSSLFTSFREDTSPKCRAAALGVVAAMLEGSRWFLSLAADEIGSPSQHRAASFVPFSATIAASVREIHKQLLSASSKEQSTLALVQLLKTISILIMNTPYHKMRPGLLTRMAAQSRYYLVNSRDLNIRVACLTVLGSITTSSAPLAEVTEILLDSSSLPASSPLTGQPEIEKQDSTVTMETSSWLINHCIMLAGPTQTTDHDPVEIHPSIRVASLQTLTRISKGYMKDAMHYISSFTVLICNCLDEMILPVRLHGCKLLEQIGSSLLHMMRTDKSSELEKQGFSIWSQVLSGHLQSVLQDSSSSALQGEACDSLSTIGPTVFPLLPRNLQILCITVLLGFSSDENALIRSKAVRALGVYISFPCLREDIVFVEDVTSFVLRLLEDPFLNVRANAAWSLGNLTDTIVINKERRPAFKDEFQSTLLLKVFRRGIKAMGDKDKVRFNMMRVLGNLLRFTDKSHSENEEFRTLMLQATEVLAKMVSENTMVKVRWNACIACSNFLRNTSLPLGDTKWTDHVYRSLCESTTSCKNFKVRIKAALALSTPTKRAYYGSMFSEVFSCLVRGLEESNMAADFTEFKFKDTLQDQLCCTFVHLTNMMEGVDLPSVCVSLRGKTEEVRQRLFEYNRRILNKIEIENEVTTNSSLNSSNISTNEGNLDITTGTDPDPVEQYIVARQLTSEEKLSALKQAIDWTTTLTVDEDVNENSVHSEVNLNKKEFRAQADQKLLSEIFTFEKLFRVLEYAENSICSNG